MKNKLKQIRDNNIKIEGASGAFSAKVDVLTQTEDIGPVDLAIISVKSTVSS